MAKGLILDKGVKKNYIALVLDKSGSMGHIREEIIDAFNTNIETIKAETEGMETKVCLVVFSTHGTQEVVLWMADVNDIEKLTEDSYITGGMTAMYDAVGYTLDRLTAETKNEEGDISYLITVISDGQENDSKEYRGSRISEMVKERENDGSWTITYIGANQDLATVSQDIGIRAKNMLSFGTTGQGVMDMSHAHSTGTRSYFGARREGRRSVDNLYEGVSVEDSKEASE